MTRTWLTVVSLALLVAPVDASAQDQLYFTEYKFEDPTLKVVNFDGTGLDDLFDPGFSLPSSDWLTVGLALDEAAGKIYWLHGSTPGRIGRANLDGTGQETLVSGLKLPRGLALDLENGKMYWSGSPPAGNAGGLLLRANLDGTAQETVYSDPDYDPVLSKIGRPTVDSVNGWVYFASNDRILRANLGGPPFQLFTVVTGVSTARAVAIDADDDHIYWIGADTIEDVVCRAKLDNTEFTVVRDFSPDSGSSNGLGDLVLDLAGGDYFVCDDLGDFIRRGSLDGASLTTIYTAPAGFSPSAMTLNANVAQPLVDCNGNLQPDADDVISGASDDCNGNGIPDECESDPCAPPDWLLDQSADVTSPGRALGGAPQNQSWIVFQPFDVPAGGWELAEIRLNGVTWTYRPEGFTATIFPDDGTDYPDESAPLGAGSAFFRFAPEWVAIPMPIVLPEGRHWVRLTANDSNEYVATVSTVSSGPASFSRSGLGNDFPGQAPIALRILRAPPATGAPALANAPVLGLRVASANPTARACELTFSLSRGGNADLAIHDVRGRRLRTLVSGELPAGVHRLTWDGRDDAGDLVASGVHFARLEAGGEKEVARVVLRR